MNVKKNVVEWAVFFVSVAVIVATTILLLSASSRSDGGVADLRISTGTPVPSSGGFGVPVIVSNAGDATAEQAVIEVVLQSGEKEMERAELTLALVPRRSEREGLVIFKKDPRCCTISTRATAYEKP